MPTQALHNAQLNAARTSLDTDFFETPGTFVHPTSLIGEHVVLGENVKIGPFCTIIGNTTIGDNTQISGYSSIGMHAQDRSTSRNWGRIVIGAHTQIREYTSIHAPKIENGETRIGDHCYIMNYCHIAHDVIVEDYVTLINNVNLAGHVHVEHHAMLMANSAVHQFCRIGKYSSLTPFSGTRQDLPPFCSFTGQPAHFTSLHLVALKRNGFDAQSIKDLSLVTELFYRKKALLPAIMEIGANEQPSWFNNPLVQDFLAFIQTSKRGISKRECSYASETFY